MCFHAKAPAHGGNRHLMGYSNNLTERCSSDDTACIDPTDTRGGLRRWGDQAFSGFAPGSTSRRQLCEETATREPEIRCLGDEVPFDTDAFLNVDQSRGNAAPQRSLESGSSTVRDTFDGGSHVNYFRNCNVLESDFRFASDDTNSGHAILAEETMLSCATVGLDVVGAGDTLSHLNRARRDESFMGREDLSAEYLSDSPESVVCESQAV